MTPRDHRTELTRDELYTLVWAEPMTTLARQYGLSDRGLAKLCDRKGIPTPGRDYWAKLQSIHRQINKAPPGPFCLSGSGMWI